MFGAGECLLRQGELAAFAGVVVAGTVNIYNDGRLVGHLCKGDLLGEMAMFKGGVSSDPGMDEMGACKRDGRG